MKFKDTEVWGFEHAIRGVRNPMNSWDRSDSEFYHVNNKDNFIGPNDLALLQKLIKAGPEHRKFMRQIMVSVDITAPLYWWKEFDTYKVGTVANSTSTMHKLATTPITLDCFEIDDYDSSIPVGLYAMSGTPEYSPEPDYTQKRPVLWIYDTNENGEKYGEPFIGYSNNTEEENFPLETCAYSIINFLERLRQKYLETKDKKYWKELIRWLPESWLQTRTVTMNYENLLAMCGKGQRRFHKLTEWSKSFIDWARTLPYAQELIFIDELEEK
jgi:hypothetical protein